MSAVIGDPRLPERFWNKVSESADDCWLWVGSLKTSGYGQFRWAGAPRSAHLVAYEALVQDLPDGHEVNHLCRIRHCVNPTHLSPATHSESRRRRATIIERLVRRSERDLVTGCLHWTGRRNREGYGQIKIGGRAGRKPAAHRVAWEVWVGPIPEGLEIDHLCRVRDCIEPSHLEPVTRAENLRRAREAQRGVVR